MIDAVPEDTHALALEKDMGKRGGKTNRVGKYKCDVPNIQDKRKTAPVYPPLGPRFSVWLRVAAGCGCHRCGRVTIKRLAGGGAPLLAATSRH